MESIIKDIIEYIKTQNPEIIIKNTKADTITLNSLCADLLSWLKLERKREIWISDGKKTSLKPLKLDRSYDWCNLLIQLVEHETLFNETFEVINDQLFLRHDLPNEIKSHIRNEAYQLYNPQPIIN